MMESVADAIEQVLNEHECGLAHLLKILRNQGLQLMARGFHRSFHLLRRKKEREREQELVLVLVGDGQEVANRPSPAVVRERK
jgi:Mg-chelatase subunit ChlD